tara:strand:+ start:322 stop:519 length:198 start_codon:yes stop_codon:yes gene_type:complete
MTEDQLTLLIIRQNSRILTLAMARARAIEILAEQKKKEDEAFTTRFFAKGDNAPNPIKQLNNLSL